MWVNKEMEKPTCIHGVQGGDESKLTSETLWDSLNAGITAALGVIEEIDKNI